LHANNDANTFEYYANVQTEFMKSIKEKIILYLLANPPKTEQDILSVKRKFSKEYNIKLPTNAQLISVYREMIKKGKIKQSKNLENLLRKKQIRTLSGVAPIAVLTKSYKCPGNCIYCPSEKDMPKSYLSNEPAVMRAQLCDFHPFKQVALRIKALQANGHETDKLELIVMGGTWDGLPNKYQLWYIYNCFAAANNPAIKTQNSINNKQGKIKIKKIKLKTQSQVTWKDLYREQKKNETAKHRIVGLTLETRPDYISQKSALQMREFGCTRVEIGVQHIDDKILKLNNRGHGVKETIKATKILRDFGFKITYHLMPNLPVSTPAKDLKMFKEIFSNPDFQPDQIKIYPCVVTKNSKLYKWWKQKKYKPYSEKVLRNLLRNIKSIVPYYVRIIRVIRDIPEESIVAGNKITNLRDLLNIKCKCIRCREVGHQKKNRELRIKNQGKIKLFIQKYRAGGPARNATHNVAGGYTEYFLSYESSDRKILYAFCRLRVPKKTSDTGYWTLDTPIIRELHVYGQMVPVSDKIKSASQHKGLGKKLLKEAEKIVKQNKFNQIAVISGIGVREYYKKQNYKLKDTYMIKLMNNEE